MSTRLNKLLSNRGIGARRKCDAIIAEGRVRVNGRVVKEPGTTVEEQRDRVEVDGRPLPGPRKNSYFVINKPVGVITTMNDPQGRRTIADFLPRGQRLYPVGRLDADTSGLLLLTNDGELAHRLMHPRYGVEKVYRVRLDREPSGQQLERLAAGVEFEPGVVSARARVRRIDPGFDAIMIEVTIHEGRFRQVRRMCEAVGLAVTGLHRVGYGPVRLGPLARGVWRELADSEVERLRAASARPQRRDRPPGAPGRPPRPAPPKAARRVPEPDEDAGIEETWIAGGGFVPDDDDEPGEWPARAGRARGDDAFRESGQAPRPRGGSAPWHAPEYRRGTAAAARRAERSAPRPGPGSERPPKPAGRPSPRTEFRTERPSKAAGRPSLRPGPRAERPSKPAGRPSLRPEFRTERPSKPAGPPARRTERASKPTGWPARRTERASKPIGWPARRTERPSKPAGPPARRAERASKPIGWPVRRTERASKPAPRPAPRGERASRPTGWPAPRPERGAGSASRRPGPARGRRDESARAGGREERARPRGPGERPGPARGRRDERERPRGRGDARAISPRAGRAPGPDRSGGRRGRPTGSAGGRDRRQSGRERRPRKR